MLSIVRQGDELIVVMRNYYGEVVGRVPLDHKQAGELAIQLLRHCLQMVPPPPEDPEPLVPVTFGTRWQRLEFEDGHECPRP